MEKVKSDDIPILIVGFNRIEFLMARIREVVSTAAPKIYISIDGEGLDKCSIKLLEKLCRENDQSGNRFIILERPQNLGLSNHITTAITEILNNYLAVVVMEDDIQIGDNFYENISLRLRNLEEKYFGVSGFSSLSFGKHLPNRWRESKYISIWGWGVTAKSWKKYNLYLEPKDIESRLQGSQVWQTISRKQRDIWLNRFKKVAHNPLLTWDYQVQFACFVHELMNLQPIFRMSENVGFGSQRSTNTKKKRPRYLGAAMINNKRINNQSLLNRIMSAQLDFLDEFAIVGTRKIYSILFHFSKRKK